MTKQKRSNRIIAAAALICAAGMIIGCSMGRKALPDGHRYIEGRYLRGSGADMIIIDGGTAGTMTASDKSVSFSSLTDGDRIRAEVSSTAETFPLQMAVFSLEKLSDGERGDIDAGILAQLAAMGSIAPDTVPAVTTMYVPAETEVPVSSASVLPAPAQLQETEPAYDVDYSRYVVPATGDIVSDSYAVSFEYPTPYYDFSSEMHIPHINLAKANAEKWNDTIASTLLAAHKQVIGEIGHSGTSTGFFTVGYAIFDTDGIITIAVSDSGGLIGTGAFYLRYLICHYDAANDSFLSDDEFLAAYTGGKWTTAKILEAANAQGFNTDENGNYIPLEADDIQGVIPSPLSAGGIDVCYQGYTVEAVAATRRYMAENSTYTASDGSVCEYWLTYGRGGYTLLGSVNGSAMVIYPVNYSGTPDDLITGNVSVGFAENAYVYLKLSADTAAGRVDDMYISLDSIPQIVSFGMPLAVTSIDDWKQLGLTQDDPRYPFFRAFLERDTAALEALSGYPSGLLDSYKQLRFGGCAIVKGVSDEYGSDSLSLLIEITQGTDAMPAGNYEFAYDEYPVNCLKRIFPASGYENEPYSVLKSLLDKTLDYKLGGPAGPLTEYIIERLDRERITAQDIAAYAAKYLGAANFTPDDSCKDDNGYYYVPGHGGSRIICRQISESYDKPSGKYTVSVRFYADYGRTVFSHLVTYRMQEIDGDWAYLGYEVIERGAFEPFGYMT